MKKKREDFSSLIIDQTEILNSLIVTVRILPSASFVAVADGAIADCPRIILERGILDVVACEGGRAQTVR